MNSQKRLEDAGERKGWEASEPESRAGTTLHTQVFTLGEEMIVEVAYDRGAVRGAYLYDAISDKDDHLERRDKNKADRIEDVLLCNGRQF